MVSKTSTDFVYGVVDTIETRLIAAHNSQVLVIEPIDMFEVAIEERKTRDNILRVSDSEKDRLL